MISVIFAKKEISFEGTIFGGSLFLGGVGGVATFGIRLGLGLGLLEYS